MPWSPGALVKAVRGSLLYYTLCYRYPGAELYNGDTLLKTLFTGGCILGGIPGGGIIVFRYADGSADAYTFNKVVLKRDPYTAPDGSSKDVILTVDIPEGKTKAADSALSFFIRLNIDTTSG